MHYDGRIVRFVAGVMFALALLLAVFGVYALARTDVQGGADAAGAILLLIAVCVAALGGFVVAAFRHKS